jgi:hypothetical protein
VLNATFSNITHTNYMNDVAGEYQTVTIHRQHHNTTNLYSDRSRLSGLEEVENTRGDDDDDD